HAGTHQIARQYRSDAAADAEADEKRRHDQREGVGGGAEQQRQNARPDDFRGQRGTARQRNRDVDHTGAVRTSHGGGGGGGRPIGRRSGDHDSQQRDQHIDAHG